MTKSSEQLDLFIDGHAELPVLSAYQMMMVSVNGVRFKSELKKIAAGATLPRAILTGEMTEAEAQDIIAAKAAKRAELSASADPERTLPDEVPESLHHLPLPTVEYQPEPREFDARERAAGAHLDR